MYEVLWSNQRRNGRGTLLGLAVRRPLVSGSRPLVVNRTVFQALKAAPDKVINLRKSEM